MGLKTGQTLAVSTGPRDEILLLPVEPAAGARDLEEMRRRLRAAGRKQGGNPLAELEERRRQERLSGRLEHGQRGH
jgi:hypothetical protein